MTTRMGEVIPTSTHEARDWRQHMDSLPTGEARFPKGALWLFLGPFLLVVGTLVVVIGGAALGLSIGIGPEDTGGTVYVISGFIPNVALGWLMVFIGKRRGYSRASCRAAFFTFTACVWVFLLWLALKLGQHFLAR